MSVFLAWRSQRTESVSTPVIRSCVSYVFRLYQIGCFGKGIVLLLSRYHRLGEVLTNEKLLCNIRTDTWSCVTHDFGLKILNVGSVTGSLIPIILANSQLGQAWIFTIQTRESSPV
jgi:hypothetical protein